MSSTPVLPTTEVVIEQKRTIRAPRSRVFRAWTEPAQLRQWFGPENMHCPHAEIDLREGGSYRIDVHAEPGTQTASGRNANSARGVFSRIVPDELLQFTWIPSWSMGEESLVTITLRDVDGGTELVLRHERLLSTESCRGYEMGWAGSLRKLAAWLNG